MNFVNARAALASLLVVGLGSGSLGCRQVAACPPGYREAPNEHRCFRTVDDPDGSAQLDPEPEENDGGKQDPINVPVPRRDSGVLPDSGSPRDAAPAADGQVGPSLADSGGERPADSGAEPPADAGAEPPQDPGRKPDAGTDPGPTTPPPPYLPTWGPRETLPVVLNGPPELIARAAGRVDVFWADGTLRRMTNAAARPSRWGAVEDLGAPAGVTLRGPVDAVSWGPNRVDVFVRGTDNRLWHTAFEGESRVAWDNPGGVSGLGSSPHACSWGIERLDIVWMTTEGSVGHIAYVDHRFGWSVVSELGAPAGALEGEARIVSWGKNRLDIVARGRDHRLWHTYWDDAWAGRWGNPLEVSQVGEGPELISRGPGLLDFVWASADINALQVLSFNGSGFDDIKTIDGPAGVNVQQRPTVSSWARERLDVFVAGDSNRLWHALYDGTGWRWGSYFSDSDLIGAPNVQSAGVDQLAIGFPVQGNKLGYVSFF